ncbi:MAG: HD domain-containing protein [bacterium]|nr:HD domain-containing protein [bacterium]
MRTNIVVEADLVSAECFLRKIYEDEAGFPSSPVSEALVRLNLEHTKRVKENAVKIADKEGIDKNILQLAAILHDVAKLDHNDIASGGVDTFHHHHRGASLARKFILQNLKKDVGVTEEICRAIDRHSCIPFIDRYWMKNYGVRVPEPEWFSEFALRDADTLDQLGLGGIRKIVHLRQATGSIFYKEDGGDIRSAIDSAHKSFMEARGIIVTDTGKRIASEYVFNAEMFFKKLVCVSSLKEFDEVYDNVSARIALANL